MAIKNSRHERFAQELAKGCSADEAYALAGYKPDRGHASRLAANGSIKKRVAELKERAADKVSVTLESIAAQLDQDRALAHAVGQAGPAVAATMGKAKLFGLVIDKAKVEATSMVVTEMVDRPPRESREDWLARKKRELEATP